MYYTSRICQIDLPQQVTFHRPTLNQVMMSGLIPHVGLTLTVQS